MRRIRDHRLAASSYAAGASEAHARTAAHPPPLQRKPSRPSAACWTKLFPEAAWAVLISCSVSYLLSRQLPLFITVCLAHFESLTVPPFNTTLCICFPFSNLLEREDDPPTIVVRPA
jgi:hypothetical protein